VERWTEHPIFRSQKHISLEKREYIKLIRLQNSSIGLSNSLRGMGRGTMPSLWEDLPALTQPVLLLAGELDPDHVALLNRMHSLLPQSTSRVVEKAGHNIHFERPDLFFDITRAFFNVHNA